MSKHHLVLLALLIVLLSCQSVTAQPSATVRVYGTAAPGTLVHIYYPTGSETDARADDSGAWGQDVTRQSGAFEMVADGGCITAGPDGATVRNCKATFKLPSGESYGGFVVGEGE
jgi:hypothetical protein